MPLNRTQMAYGTFMLRYVASVWDARSRLRDGPVVQAPWPLSFEQLSQAQGLVLYVCRLRRNYDEGTRFQIKNLADRAFVLINGRLSLVLARTGDHTVARLPAPAKAGDSLGVMVENTGRDSSGRPDVKGMFVVIIDGDTPSGWTMHRLGLGHMNISRINQQIQHIAGHPLRADQKRRRRIRAALLSAIRAKPVMLPALFSFQLDLPPQVGAVADTFLQVPTAFQHGLAFLNGVPLGRYYSSSLDDVHNELIQGPRKRRIRKLFVPASMLLGPGQENEVVLLEFQSAACFPLCFAQLTTSSTATTAAPTPIVTIDIHSRKNAGFA
ncbi:unnamed protein product [Notodromas monacha]|uniref:Uncharacterized protein n=1 Tax=Notodromas monacha TaxID=399045 RepID=A0A7R9BND9_9CRUS|nr:unnamed protein product [Notodromas monacha]CAG0918672.1 unnamed protein product [Notodromas monacha]